VAACRYKRFDPTGAFVEKLANELMSPSLINVQGMRDDHAKAMTWPNPPKGETWSWAFAGYGVPEAKAFTAITTESDYSSPNHPPPERWRLSKSPLKLSNIRLVWAITLPEPAPAGEEQVTQGALRPDADNEPKKKRKRKKPRTAISQVTWLRKEKKWKKEQDALKEEVEQKAALVKTLEAKAKAKKRSKTLVGHAPKQFTLLQASYDGSGLCVGIPSFLVDFGDKYGPPAGKRERAAELADLYGNVLDPRTDKAKKKGRYQWSSEAHDNKALYAAAKATDGADALMLAGFQAGMINVIKE